MNPTYFIPFLVILIIFLMIGKEEKAMVAIKLNQKRKSEDKTQMIELAKRFIDKACLIYTFDGNQIDCTIKEVSGGALLVESNGAVEAINFDFIMRIREYPKKKNGKKKSVVLD